MQLVPLLGVILLLQSILHRLVCNIIFFVIHIVIHSIVIVFILVILVVSILCFISGIIVVIRIEGNAVTVFSLEFL